MKVSKAIEILEDYHKHLPTRINNDYLDSLRLSIEALRRILNIRVIELDPELHHLPGETPDDK